MQVKSVLKLLGYIAGAIFVPGGCIVAARKVYIERTNILNKLKSIRDWFKRKAPEAKPIEKIEAPSIIEELEKDLMNPGNRIYLSYAQYQDSIIRRIRERRATIPQTHIKEVKPESLELPKLVSSRDKAMRELAEKLRPLAEERIRALQFNKDLRELGVLGN